MKRLIIVFSLLIVISNLFGEVKSKRILYSGVSEKLNEHTLKILATTFDKNILLSFQNLPTFSISNISSMDNKNDYLYNYILSDSLTYLISGEISEESDAKYTVSLNIENLITKDRQNFTDSFDTPNEVFSCSDRLSKLVINYFLQLNGITQEESLVNRNDKLNTFRTHFFQFNKTLSDTINKKYSFKGNATYCPDRHNNNEAALLVPKKAYGIIHREFNFLPYNNFTISVWIKLDDDNLTDYGRIIDCMDWTNKTGYNIIVSSKNSIINFSYFTSNHHQVSISSCESLSRNKWYNVIVTFNNGLSCVYLNGILQEKLKTNDVISKSTRYLSIGNGYEGYPSFYLSGCIDDIEVFNTELNGSEVEYLYSEEI